MRLKALKRQDHEDREPTRMSDRLHSWGNVMAVLLIIGLTVWAKVNVDDAKSAAHHADGAVANATRAASSAKRDAVSAKANASSLRRQLNAQTLNRRRNVATWCNAINATRAYDRKFVRVSSHGRLRYTLTNLNCVELEINTARSGRGGGG